MGDGKLPSFAAVAKSANTNPESVQPFVTHREFERTLEAVDKLCEAHRATQDEKYNGLKKQIWAASATVGVILSLLQLAMGIGLK